MNRRKRFVPHQWVRDLIFGLVGAAMFYAAVFAYIAVSGLSGVR